MSLTSFCKEMGLRSRARVWLAEIRISP